jgi:hypothetical protein
VRSRKRKLENSEKNRNEKQLGYKLNRSAKPPQKLRLTD